MKEKKRHRLDSSCKLNCKRNDAIFMLFVPSSPISPKSELPASIDGKKQFHNYYIQLKRLQNANKDKTKEKPANCFTLMCNCTFCVHVRCNELGAHEFDILNNWSVHFALLINATLFCFETEKRKKKKNEK